MALFLSLPSFSSVFPSEAVSPQGALGRFLKFVDTRQDPDPHDTAGCLLTAAFLLRYRKPEELCESLL